MTTQPKTHTTIRGFRGIVFLLSTLFFAFTSTAQVQNCCLRLSAGGSVDCGPMPELNGLESFTLQFWMNADEWTEGATLMSRGDDLRLSLGEANTLVLTFNGKSYSITRNALKEKTWIPIMVVGKEQRIAVYVNKTIAKNISMTTTFPASGESFVLGGDTYKGRLDEVRVWNAELSSDYDYFYNTTLNKWAPQLGNLVCYFKFDQPQCENIVDYKALFAPRQSTNHHGIPSAQGVKKEAVTDNNDGLPYLLNGQYTNNTRFFDNGIEKEKYLLANDLIILGLQSYSDGHVLPLTPCDHATVKNGTYNERYKNRLGVLKLEGNGYLECPTSVFKPSSGYTLETWVYLDEWTEGAFIFRKENTAGTKGFSLRLGEEATRQLIVRINGKQFVFPKSIQANRWQYVVITPGSGTENTNAVVCNVSGTSYRADATLSDDATDAMPTGMDNLKFYVGEKIKGAVDETAIWHRTFSVDEFADHRNNKMPMPGPGKPVTQAMMNVTNAFYRYNNPDQLGWDYYSQDEWKNIMESCYDGYSGYQIRISVQGHSNWQNTISDASKRKIFAADVAEYVKPYAGVELDLEWMDGTQTNLGLLADEILKVLPAGKTLVISHHQYGAYQFPKDKISKVHGFTFQQYGPQKTWYNYPSFEQGYNAFKNYGYPNNKIYLSYSTTTSGGYDESGSKVGDVIGYKWGIITSDYVPATDGSFERGLYKGLYYYFHGPVQVYNRAKFCRDNQLMGIFCWDLCNDLAPSHKYSLAKWSNYALCANVDPVVTEAAPKHPTAINQVVMPSGTSSEATYDLQGRRVSEHSIQHGVVIKNGEKILR